MKDVGVNSIFCLSYRIGYTNSVLALKKGLRNCEDFICKTCSTTAGAVNLFPTCITIDSDENVLLYGSETWPLSTEDLSRIKRCDHAMIRWLNNAKIWS